MPRKRDGFLTFLFSIVPGGGHMYLGLMNRGVQLMAIALFGVAFTAIFDLASMGMPLFILVFFYAEFDAMHLKNMLNAGISVEDEPLLARFRINWGIYHTGITLIVLGGWLFISRAASSIARLMPGIYTIMNEITAVLPAIAIVMVGLILVMRNARAKAGAQAEDAPKE